MREPPRRRRIDDERSEGGLPLFPLVLVVILAGLLLGGVLAHFFGGAHRVATPATRVAIAPATAEPTTEATVVASTSPTAVATQPTSRPSVNSPARATLKTPVAPTARPTQRAIAGTPTPTRAILTPPPVRGSSAPVRVTATPAVVTRPMVARPSAAPAAPAAPAAGDPAGVVRAYLAALAHGDRQTAAEYLSHGAPTESFMTAGSRVAAIRSTAIGAQQYRVTADVQTGSGEYYVTFTVAPGPGGLQITDHYAIKPQ